MCDLIYTSGDVLNIVLAAAIAIIAILLAWGMFYGVMMMRNTFQVIKDLKTIVQETKNVVLLAKEKAKSGTYLLKVLREGIQKTTEFIEKKTKKKSSKKK